MKVVIAIDSFKGSMTSMQAGAAAKEGILNVTNADVVVKPLADGGEGTTQALIEGLGGTFEQAEVTGPLGAKTVAHYGILADKQTAVMEMALPFPRCCPLLGKLLLLMEKKFPMKSKNVTSKLLVMLQILYAGIMEALLYLALKKA